jgi:hypothetical protein
MHFLVKLARVWITAYNSASSLIFDVTATGLPHTQLFIIQLRPIYTTCWRPLGDNRLIFEDSDPTTTIRKGNVFGNKLFCYIKIMEGFQSIDFHTIGGYRK